MNTFLLNNTKNYHKGCEVVAEYLINKYDVSDWRYTRDQLEDIDFSKYDRVVLNGEGTLHHNTRSARRQLTALRLAQYAGCETHLVNTVWQEMSNTWDDVLANCKSVQVREVLSQYEMSSKHGRLPTVAPDCSYLHDNVAVREFAHVAVYEGQYMKSNPYGVQGGYPRIDIFSQTWEEIVNRLRNCDLLITGRHHEMYAACVAECRFLVTPGNTWKNQGLLKSAGVDIPFDVDGALSGKYDDQYNRLWDYLRAFRTK